MAKDPALQQTLERLEAALARQEPEHRTGACPSQFPIENTLLALKAQDFFLGRLPAADRLEVGLGLNRCIQARLGLPLAASPTLLGTISANPWDIVDQILAWVKYVGDLAGAPFNLGFGVPVALGFAIYYKRNPPTPDDCSPNELDKWRHCYVGCKIAFWTPGGFQLSHALAILKEIADSFGLGTAELEDITATLRGVYTCGFFEGCEDCCCAKGY